MDTHSDYTNFPTQSFNDSCVWTLNSADYCDRTLVPITITEMSTQFYESVSEMQPSAFQSTPADPSSAV